MTNALTKPLGSLGDWRPNKYMPSINETMSPKAFHEGEARRNAGIKLGIRSPRVAPIDAPPPPTIEDAESSREAESARLRRRRGRAAAVVNDGSVPMTAAKTLLGG